MDTQNKHNFFILDIIIFAGVNAVMLVWLHRNHTEMPEFSWFHMVLFGLAVYRLANVISNERITKPLREPFVTEILEDGKKVEKPKSRGFKGAVGDLIYCPSCSGVWVSMLLVYSYIVWPRPAFMLTILFAMSGIERIISSTLGLVRTEERTIKELNKINEPHRLTRR